MSEYGSFQIDLVTTSKADKEKLEFIQAEILKLEFDKNLLEKISTSIEIGKTMVWEIFLEEDGVEILDEEEFSNLISSLESVLGDFSLGSNYSWTVDLPFSTKFWQKEISGWEVIFEEQNPFEEGSNINDFDIWDDE
jgi:hypothetical protein